MPANILLAGEGGQGIQSIAKILTKAANKSGKNTTYLPSFGVEQRGGVSLAFVQISSNKINYPRFSDANIVVAFSNRSIDSVKDYLTDNTLFIYDDSIIKEKNIEKIKSLIKNHIGISAQEIAKEKYSIKAANMIMLGAISNQLKDVSYNDFDYSINKEFESKIAKNPEIRKLNTGAFQEGLNIAENFDKEKKPLKGIEENEVQREFKKDKITWNRYPEYCKGCALCIVKCPVKALKYSKDNNFLGTLMPEVDIDKCIACKKCMEICPDGSIKVDKK